MTADQTGVDDTRDALAEVLHAAVCSCIGVNAHLAEGRWAFRVQARDLRTAGYVSLADHAAALAQAKAEGGQEVAARVEAVLADLVATLSRSPGSTRPTNEAGRATASAVAAVRAALPPDAGAAHDRRVRSEAVMAFVRHIASSGAHNGAGDPGQALYDYGINPWLHDQAAEWLRDPADREGTDETLG